MIQSCIRSPGLICLSVSMIKPIACRNYCDLLAKIIQSVANEETQCFLIDDLNTLDFYDNDTGQISLSSSNTLFAACSLLHNHYILFDVCFSEVLCNGSLYPSLTYHVNVAFSV